MAYYPETHATVEVHIFFPILPLILRGLYPALTTNLVKLLPDEQSHGLGVRALPQIYKYERSTSIAFADIQLSPTLIDLSLLNSCHPGILPHTRVRPPKECCHYSISLLNFRSVGLGYLTKDFRVYPYRSTLVDAFYDRGANTFFFQS